MTEVLLRRRETMRAKLLTSFELYLPEGIEDGEPEVSFTKGQNVEVLHTFECHDYVGGSAAVIFDGKESATVGLDLLELIKEATIS